MIYRLQIENFQNINIYNLNYYIFHHNNLNKLLYNDYFVFFYDKSRFLY